MPVRTAGQSKVARRIVVLFVVCALVPVVCLSVVASIQVTGELRSASRARLHQAAKSLGMDLLDQLRRLDSDLALVGTTILAGGPPSSIAIPAALQQRLTEQFSSLAVIAPDGTPRVIIGSSPASGLPTGPELAHMHAGKAVLTAVPQTGRPPKLVMTRLVESWGAGHLLQAQINEAFIWNRESMPPQMEIHVLGSSLEPLFTSMTSSAAVLDADAIRTMAASATGEAEWTHDGEAYVARYWSLPLNFDFLAPDWKIVASEARTEMLAPIQSSQITFILITTLSLWIVTLLSLSLVRRSMGPLAELREGTQRLGRGDFEGRVDVKSGDEFEELAGSFNTMAGQLKRHFDTLSSMAELDRAVLSSLDVETIVRGALERLPRLMDCDHLAIIVLGPASSPDARAFVTARNGMGPTRELVLEISSGTRLLIADKRVIRVSFEETLPDYLSPIVSKRWATCVVFPLALKNRLVGILVIGDETRRERSTEDLQHARQLAAQVGVALSNADLIQALDRLNVGTLSALARTVDAKSPWTAGHSQRVTEMAVAIGRALGVSASDLDTLARGGLLHDIGKIAVPTSILNKPGPMTKEEFALMREHPRTGARILEPIAEYVHLIPIVLQHHEWFDGRGYPLGLSGESIDPNARIVAVADVFDALTSERPYRGALSREQAVAIICAGKGTQFDPRVVNAFLTMLEETAVSGERPPLPRTIERATLTARVLSA